MSIQKLLNEFTFYRKLRPLKIILNCKNSEVRTNFAIRLSKFYNIPIINYTSIVKTLSISEKDLDDEEYGMYKPFLELKQKLDKELDENKRNEIMYDALKEILRENVCRNRGYVLTGIPISEEEIQLLYWSSFILNIARTQKPLEEGDEGYEPPEENVEEEVIEEKKDEEKKVEEKKEEDEINKDGEANQENEEGAQNKEQIERPVEENNNNNNNENPEEVQVKKKKQKPIKYKTIVTYNKDLIPESVITIRRYHEFQEDDKFQSIKTKKTIKKNFEGYNVFFKVELFFQEKQIEILDLILEKDKEEMFESIRIYVERAGRPFNYFKDFEDDIHNKRMKQIKDRYIKKESDKKSEIFQSEKLKMESEKEYWDKMMKRINQIKQDKEEVISAEQLPTRKFLLLNIMPILTKGLLEVCKINPIDPIDHLADFLFQNSNDL